MSEDSLFRRVLRGSTASKQKEEPRKENVPAEPVPEIGLPEKILSTPLNRRRVLGGAATSVGHMASSAALPQAPLVIQQAPLVIQNGISEQTVRLSHLLEELHTLESITDLNATSKIKYTNTNRKLESKQIPQTPIEDLLRSGLPLNEETETGVDIGQVLDQMDEFVRVAQITDLLDAEEAALPVSALKNVDMLVEAERIRNNYDFSVDHDKEFAQKRANDMIQSISLLQKIADVPDDCTLLGLQETLERKIIVAVERIVDTTAAFPPYGTYQLETAYERLGRILERVGGDLEPISQRIESLLVDTRTARYKREGEEHDARNSEARQLFAEEDKRKIEAVKLKRERVNIDMSERPAIKCTVRKIAREERDAANAKVFLMVPKEAENESPGWSSHSSPVPLYEFQGLTRMHIQHLRQQLTQSGAIDSFDPATTRVEILGTMARVSTTDEQFQQYLESASQKKDALLEVPDRLQVTLPPDKQQE